MADLLAHLPLTRLAPSGHYGATGTGVRLRVLDQYELASVSAARQQASALSERCEVQFGHALADQPCVSGGEAISFLGIGPARWLAIAPQGERLIARLNEAFGVSASICDQSDGYVSFAADGPSVRDCLAKGPSIDFSASAFAPGCVATTSMGHIGLVIWRTDEPDAFRMAVPSSFAPSFQRLFLAGAAEFGVALT